MEQTTWMPDGSTGTRAAWLLKHKARISHTSRHSRFAYHGHGAQPIAGEPMHVSIDDPIAEKPADTAPFAPERRRRRAKQQQTPRPVVGTMDTAHVPAVSRDGVRKGVGITVICCLCFVLGIATLVDVSNMMDEGKELSRIETEIEELKRANDDMRVTLANNQSSLNVGYEAAKLGMISAKGVDVIYITAPETVTVSAETVDSVQGEHLATILGD